MNTDNINATLAMMEPGEVRQVLHYINGWERAGNISANEAADWRLRALAYQRMVMLTDDPDLVV